MGSYGYTEMKQSLLFPSTEMNHPESSRNMRIYIYPTGVRDCKRRYYHHQLWNIKSIYEKDDCWSFMMYNSRKTCNNHDHAICLIQKDVDVDQKKHQESHP